LTSREGEIGTSAVNDWTGASSYSYKTRRTGKWFGKRKGLFKKEKSSKNPGSGEKKGGKRPGENEYRPGRGMRGFGKRKTSSEKGKHLLREGKVLRRKKTSITNLVERNKVREGKGRTFSLVARGRKKGGGNPFPEFNLPTRR